MNRRSWNDRNGHPPADLLLLHVEDELEGRTADQVRLHVNHCADCRRACHELARGLSQFVAFRDSVVLPTPTPRPTELRELLRRQIPQTPARSFTSGILSLFRLDSPRRLAYALGALSLCVIVWLSFYLSAPRQSVYASQILEEARSSSNVLAAHAKVLSQTVRLRRGNLIIQRIVHHGRQATAQTRDGSIDPQLQRELDLAHIDMNDPLNANDFAQWRTAQPDHTDSVKETSDNVTITTRVPGAAIDEGSLTLSRSGWRPIARSVEFRGEAPIEISEVSYSIIDLSTVQHGPEASNPTAVAMGHIGAPTASSTITNSELENSELELRESFHSIGADVSASPEIWRSGQTVFFYATSGKPEELAKMRELAARIPNVKGSDRPLVRPSESSQPIGGSGPYTTTPPLAGALEAKLGDAHAVASFMDALRIRSSRMLAEATALDQLGKRYTPDTMKDLSPALRTRVSHLATSMFSSLQHDSAEYVKLLSPTLDEMAHQLSISRPAEESDDVPGCLPWQQNAAVAVPQLRDLAQNVSLLFVPQKTANPTDLSARELLVNSLRERSFLEIHLTSACQLFGAN